MGSDIPGFLHTGFYPTSTGRKARVFLSLTDYMDAMSIDNTVSTNRPNNQQWELFPAAVLEFSGTQNNPSRSKAMQKWPRRQGLKMKVS